MPQKQNFDLGLDENAAGAASSATPAMTGPETRTRGVAQGGKSGAVRFPCGSCGGDMTFDPKAGMMKCPYCGATAPVPAEATGDVEERDLEAYLSGRMGELSKMSDVAVEVQCGGCGATTTFEPPLVAGDCPFCGAQIVALPRAADPLVAPEGVLPFTVPQRQATESIRTWVGTRWFAPNALKKQAKTGAIGGVYLPFWTYDAQTHSRYTGQRGEHYYETEYYTTTDSEGKTTQQSRQVRKTRWYSASGQVSRFFDDVTVAASTSIPRARLDALEPWGLENLKPYEPAYLSGFKAQRYQIKLDEGFLVAKDVMAGVIDSDVRRDIGGDEQRVSSVNTSYSDMTFKHLLLPVWISAYRYQNKVYQVIVNARTGEVQGDRPYSVWKITFAVLLGLLVAFIIYSLASGSSN